MRKLKRRSFLAAMPAAVSAPLAAANPGENAAGGQISADKIGAPVRATRLSAGYVGPQSYDAQERDELLEALESRSLFRWYGPAAPRKVARFEEALAKFMGARYALAVTSGTAALHVALTALGVGPGDEVILPAWTWYSCYNTIVLTGALPVFAEVDESFSLDPADVEKKITPRTKAIMVVHLYGAPADMDGILAVGRRHNLRVLEDAAQSVGAQYKGRRLGSIGDIGIFSFQIAKVITAGEGGAVLTSDPVLFERATRFHDLGMLRPGHQAVLQKAQVAWFTGGNYRMNEMTGAVMCAQLRKLDNIVSSCRRNAHTVKEQIQSLPGVRLRRIADPDGEIGLQTFLLLKDRDQRERFIAAMHAENLPAARPGGSIHLPSVPYIAQKLAMHPDWPSFNTPHGRAMRYGADCCPRTSDLINRAAYVEIGPRYTETDLRDIVAGIRRVSRALFA